MSWKESLEKFAADFDILGLVYQAEHGVSLTFDSSVSVDFREDGGALTLVCALGDVSEFARDETMSAMLIANHPAGNLAGAWLALDNAGEKAVLARRLDAGTEYEAFTEALELFVANAETWRKRLG